MLESKSANWRKEITRYAISSHRVMQIRQGDAISSIYILYSVFVYGLWSQFIVVAMLTYQFNFDPFEVIPICSCVFHANGLS